MEYALAFLAGVDSAGDIDDLIFAELDYDVSRR